MRLDQFLVDHKLARSRSHAKELVQKGLVYIHEERAKKASQSIDPQLDVSAIRIQEDKLLKYVSRAGIKLENAMGALDIDVHSYKVLDVGLSTGGFTDCLLQSGADKIIGIDVGRNQLAEKLKQNKKLKYFDSINARNLSEYEELKPDLKDLDLIVMDVSFISIKLILPELRKFMTDKTKLLSLVKPQFELQKKDLNKQGIVKDSAKYEEIKKALYELCEELQLEVIDYISSGILGGDGNEEFFIYAKSQHS